MDSSHMYLYHMTNSANQKSSCNNEAEHKIPSVILLCRHTVLYILHTKCGLVVKGHSLPFCIFSLPRKLIQHSLMFTF